MPDFDPTATAALDPAPDAGDPASTQTFGVEPTGTPGAPPTVPGYAIESELGRGGMGVVYKARDAKLDRPVALKIVLGGGHASASAVARFLAEAKAAAAVRHPGIAQVYELGEHDGLPFFAMEFCPGGSLADKLAGTPLPPREAAEVVARVAEAVQAAHAAGVVHRDLKPANVLLAADGSPRVSDFGLARRKDSNSGLTATGAVLGSPSYMAPEQAAGSKEVGPLSDVYGLGAILYECLTGRPPFRAATPLETVVQVMKDDPVPPRTLQPKLPRDLETVCLKCLHKDPRRRYASATELATDLRNYLDGRPVMARPAGVVEKAWKAARRRPAAAAGVLAAVVALAAVFAVVAWKNSQLQRERDEANAAREDAEKQRRAADVARNFANLSRAAAVEKHNQAEDERKRAERRLVVALDAIERMVRLAGEKSARNPALQAERRAVLEEVITVYRGFSAEDGEDHRVRRQTALAEVRIGTVYLALAEYEKAGQALATAETIQTHLAGMYPKEPEYANDLALTLVQAGHVHVISARFEPAAGRYARAAEQARRAIALAPDRAEFKLTLAEALTSLGHFNSRDPNLAAKYHTEVLDLARELAAEPDAGYGARLFLAVGLLNVGVIESGRRQPRGAELLAEAGKAIDALTGAHSPSARWAELFDSMRGQFLVLQGAAASRRGDGVGGLKQIDAGIAVLDSLLAVHPKSFPFQMQKLNGLSARSDVLARAGREKEAKEALAAVVELSEAIASASPSMGWVRYRFALQGSLDLIYRVQGGNVAGFDERAAAVLRSLPPGGAAGDGRYNVACAYAQATQFGEPADKEKWGREAVSLLTAVARDGYFGPQSRVSHLDTDTDIHPLRDRADYKAFRATLPNVAPPPRTVPGSGK